MEPNEIPAGFRDSAGARYGCSLFRTVPPQRGLAELSFSVAAGYAFNVIATAMTADPRAIAASCRRFHVGRLELFGSATSERFDRERSDFDFLVSFVPDAANFDNYLGSAEALEALLGRQVALLTERSVRNPYLRQTIDATRRLLYAHGEQEAAV